VNILPIVLYYRYGEYKKIPGVRRQKSNERVSCKRLEQKWTVMQRRVYQRQIHSVDELKRRLIDVWCGLEQSIFDEATDQWRGRHRACVHAKGGHLEYSL